MRIDFFGGNIDFFGDAFWGPSGFEVEITAALPTLIILLQPETGIVTTVTGTGFTFVSAADPDPTGGTISNMSFSHIGTDVATMSGLNWDLITFNSALESADIGNTAPLAALWNASPLTINGAPSSTGMDMTGIDIPFTTRMIITGSDHDDDLIGGSGRDRITPGESDGFDVVRGSAGNDKIIYTDSIMHYQELNYSGLSKRVNITIDGAANTGTVKKGALGTDTLIDVENPLKAGWVAGGYGLRGTAFNDIFNINGGAETWMQVSGGAGKDTFNLTMDGWVRMDYNSDGASGPTQGVVINLAKGKAFNDGFGNTDIFNITDGNGRLQLRGTKFDDKMTGSSAREDFIGHQGNDVINGGGDADRIRYDRNGVEAVTVDLKAGTATGVWDGENFSDTLKNIEDVRGSREGNDVIKGSGAANRMEGRGGNDRLEGRGGDDNLNGEDGRDILKGGAGNDWMVGGAGNDKHFGNGGYDNFVFHAGINEGKDTVISFQDGLDQIAIRGGAFGDVAIAASGPGGKHTKITMDSGTEILLKNTDSSLIGEEDFNFF